MSNSQTLLHELVEQIISINPLQSKFLEASISGATEEELDDLLAYVGYSQGEGLSLEYLASSYDLIVKDTLREQIYFQRHKRYRYSTFDEVADSVYFDGEYMRKYMHGLALTGYLWPNHRELHRYFCETLPVDKPGTYLEIGPGHGMYMVTAMRRTDFDVFHGLDLSPTSVEMTQRLIGSGVFGQFDNFDVFEQDFLEGELPPASYSAIVMGEVLEHVEEPGIFLERIRALATDDAFIFITTPINAPAIDHIYLFESYDSIETLVNEAGLSVSDSLLVPYPGLDVEESMRQCLPINVALVLQK